MRLITAHRILIGTFVVFSLFFSLIKLRAWRAGGGSREIVMAAASLLIAVGFGAYLARLRAPRS